jgi:hypothetical protein
MAHFRFRRSFGNVNGRMFRGARPLVQYLLNLYRGAAAAYSLRSLSRAWRKEPVVEVRRASDDTTKSFTATDIGDGTMANWVNATVALPLDTASGAAAAYSLRNLSTAYSGNVVNVRRSSDDTTADFTAAEVADGTMADWVNTDVDLTSGLTSMIFQKWFGTGTVDTATDLGFTASNATALYVRKHDGSWGTEFNVQEGDTIRFTYDASGLTWGKPELKTIGGTGNAGSSGGASFANGTGNTIEAVATDIARTFTLWVSGTSVSFDITKIEVVSASGHVVTWYDQSGNNNHAEQTTEASQPKVVDGGVLADGLKFDGAQFLTTTDYAVSLSQNSASVFSVTDATTARYILTEADVASYSSNFIYGGNSLSGVDDSTLWVNGSLFGSPFISTSSVNGFDFDGTNFQAYGNGAESGTSGTATVNAEVNGFTRIGSDAHATSPSSFYTGTMAEIICYKSDQSLKRKAIESNMADYYGDIDLPPGFDSGNNEVDGYVATWYDQSGNGNDAVQNVATSQPKIVEGGVLVAEGLKFDGGQSLAKTTFTQGQLSQPNTAFAVSKILDVGNVGFVFDGPNIAARNLIYAHLSYYKFFAGILQAIAAQDTDQHLFTALHNTTNSDAYIDGVIGASSVDVGTQGMGGITIGSRYNLASPLNGFIQEIIIYNSDQSAKRTDIEGNINDYYDIFADATYRRTDGSAIFRPDGTSVYERP